MDQAPLDEGFLADCPARLPIELLSDKWAAVVLSGLSLGPVRHGELVEVIGGISRKVLTQTLRRLEQHGLVTRSAYAQAPPRVDYELTDLGATLIEPIHVLTEWGRAHTAAVLEALDRHERQALTASAPQPELRQGGAVAERGLLPGGA